MDRNNRPRLPTSDDWNAPLLEHELPFEREYSREVFEGLSYEEAVEHFFGVGSILEAIEDLSCLPPVPFRYYLLAFLEYLQSPRLRSDPEASIARASAASAFLDLTAMRLEYWPEDLRPVLESVLPVVDFVGAHQSEYDADEGLFGAFPARAEKIRELARRVDV